MIAVLRGGSEGLVSPQSADGVHPSPLTQADRCAPSGSSTFPLPRACPPRPGPSAVSPPSSYVHQGTERRVSPYAVPLVARRGPLAAGRTSHPRLPPEAAALGWGVSARVSGGCDGGGKAPARSARLSLSGARSQAEHTGRTGGRQQPRTGDLRGPPPPASALPVTASARLNKAVVAGGGGSRRAGRRGLWANRSARRGHARQLGQWERGEGAGAAGTAGAAAGAAAGEGWGG